MNNEITTPQILRSNRFKGLALAACLFLGACGSETTDIATADEPESSTATSVVIESDDTETEATEAVPETTEDAPAEDAPPEGAPTEGERPERPEGERPERPAGGAPEGDSTDDADTLSDGPQDVGEHGPFSNADRNGDVTVTRDELDSFMDGALEREIGLVAFFDLYDEDGDDRLVADELAVVDPAFAFDGTDANEDGQVSLEEVVDYANEEGRSYRAIGLGEFFDVVDTDDNDEVSPEEIEVAHVSGLLARY